MKWKDAGGNVILKTEGLSYDASKLVGIDPSQWYDKIFKAKTTFIGSNNSGGTDWDGDDIQTTTGRDIVKAGGGDDFIKDVKGVDTYYGGAGTDFVAYTWSLAKGGVNVDLAKGTATIGGRTDKLFSIEGIRGTSKKDILKGNGADNKFGGLKGNDVIIGGKGEDEVRYHRDDRYGGSDGIVANLKKGTVKDGFGTIDTIKGIERVRGTEKADKFVDNAGKDGFRGEGGNDIFIFAGGDDWAVGGTGADKFVFKGKFGWDWVDDFNAAEGDRLKIAGAAFGDLTIGESSRGNATVTYNGNTVELNGIAQGDVDAGWFL